jgi:drug/metabolite transporter (DMT)-like permease
VVAALGLLGYNILNGLTFFRLARTTATNAALIYGFSPIMIALLAVWLLREPLGSRAAMGALLGFAGVALTITQGHPEAIRLHGMMTGNLLVFAGASYWSAYSVATRSIARRVSAETYTFYILVLGAIAPVSWVWMTQERLPLAGLGWPALLAVCFFGVSTGTLSMNFWNWGLARIEASRVGAFSYLEPLFAAAAAITFLGERPTMATALGAALVFAGVFLSAKTRTKGLAE